MEPSRDHPTPYPGKTKQRKSTRSSIKEQENKALNDTNVAITASPKRQKRVLSVSKSVNTLDLSVKDKPSRTSRRLSIPSKYATPVSKTENSEIPLSALENKSSSKPSPLSGTSPLKCGKNLGVEAKAKPRGKSLSVSFQGSSTKSYGKDNSSNKDTSSTSPGCNKSTISTTVSENSSYGQRRKFNTLMSSSYWLNHIKLSESAGKHAISLGFFRLALESTAEPLQRLCDELKAYARKHNLLEYGAIAKDVLSSYGVLEEVMLPDIDEQSVVTPMTGNGSILESRGFVTRVHESCSLIPEDAEDESNGAFDGEHTNKVRDDCLSEFEIGGLPSVPRFKDMPESSEESEFLNSKILDGEVTHVDEDIQEEVHKESTALVPVLTGSVPEEMSPKDNLMEGKGNNGCSSRNDNIKTSVSNQKICPENVSLIAGDKTESVASPTNSGRIAEKKNAIHKATKSITVPAIKSQRSGVRKSLIIDSTQKAGAANTPRCATRRSCTIITTTKNEPRGRKNSSQRGRKGSTLNDTSHSDLSYTTENGIEKDKDKQVSQRMDQTSKHKGSEHLSKGCNGELQNVLNNSTPASTGFDVLTMSVDTLMDEVVSCIMSSMDDCVDAQEEGREKSLEGQNTHTSYVAENIASEKIVSNGVISTSDNSSSGEVGHEAHADTMDSSYIQWISIAAENHIGVCQEEPLKDLVDIACSRDGYGEESGESASLIIEERHVVCTDVGLRDTVQLDTAKHEACEDTNNRVWRGKFEPKGVKCQLQGSRAITGTSGLKKDPQLEIIARLDKENTLNECCKMPLTAGGNKSSLGEEVKGLTKSNEGGKNHCQISGTTSGAIRRSTRLSGRTAT
eukprot:Gb_30698 [translate_table: standard]